MGNLILKIIIFALLWVVGAFFFSSFGDSVGTAGSMLYIGSSILGTESLANDGSDIANLLVSFIITAVVYYIVAELITLILTKMFTR